MVRPAKDRASELIAGQQFSVNEPAIQSFRGTFEGPTARRHHFTGDVGISYNSAMRLLFLLALLLIGSCATAPSTHWQQGAIQRDLPTPYDDVWHTVSNWVTDFAIIKTADYQGGVLVLEPMYAPLRPGSNWPLLMDCDATLGGWTHGFDYDIAVLVQDLGDDWTRVRFRVEYSRRDQLLPLLVLARQSKVRNTPCRSTGVWEQYALDQIEDAL